MRRIYNELVGRVYANDYSCATLAGEIGMSQSALSNKMQGKTTFTLTEMIAIGKVLSFGAQDYYTYFVAPTINKK